jgi:hypothetical protein
MQDRTDPRHGSVNQGISAAVRAPTSTKDSPPTSGRGWQIRAETEKRVSHKRVSAANEARQRSRVRL